MVRSFLAPGLFSGLYNYYIYAGRTRHLSLLASGIDANEPQVLHNNDTRAFYRSIQTEASIGALKEISGTIIIFGLLVIIVLIIVYVYRKIYDFNRSMRTLL